MYQRLKSADQVKRRNSALVPTAVVLSAPLIGMLVLRASAFNNLAYRDPWFYSGYGWAFAHHIENFGWFYYAARFPVILPIGWFAALLGPVGGYLTLRYLILVATSAVLYACVRRFASVATASAAVVGLVLNPFFLRLVLWDYTSFVALPCGIIGVTIWITSSANGRPFRPYVISGAALGAAVCANAFSVSFILPLLVVEGAAAVRAGGSEIARLALRCGAAAVGGGLLFAGGYLAYRAYVGPFSPRDLIDPSLDFARQNRDVAASFERPVRESLTGEPRIYAPLILCVALASLGRALFARSIPSRLAQYSVLYVGLLWISRAVHRSAAVETWWAYNTTAISMSFSVPVLLDHLSATRPVRFRTLVVAAIGATAVTTFAIRSENALATQVYDGIRGHRAVLIILLSAGVAVAGALARVNGGMICVALTAAIFALMAFVSLTPARYLGIRETGEFTENGRDERLAYAGAYKMTKLLEKWDEPYSRTLLWTTLSGLTMIAWADLPHQGGGIQDPEAPPSSLNHLTDKQLDLVRYPTTGKILLLSEDPSDIRDGIAELHRKETHPVVRRDGTWVDGHLHYALVEVGGATR